MERALRASRDDEAAAGALGLNVAALRLQVFVLGGAIAGLSGGLLVGFITAWSPGGWGYAETFAILTGIILGGVATIGASSWGHSWCRCLRRGAVVPSRVWLPGAD